MPHLILSTNPSYYCISFWLLSQWDSPRDLRSLTICQCQTRQRLVTTNRDYIVFPLAWQITVGAKGRSLTPLLLKTEYSGQKNSMTWLMMPWLLVLPYHQQPWYWLCAIYTPPCRPWGMISSMWVINVLRHYRKYKYISMFSVSQNKLSRAQVDIKSMFSGIGLSLQKRPP